jgi:hypothetical protein
MVFGNDGDCAPKKQRRPHRGLRVNITLHQQTKKPNKIIIRCYYKTLKKDNYLWLVILLQKSCRRGSRTAHGAVSHNTKSGGLPQSACAGIILRLF